MVTTIHLKNFTVRHEGDFGLRLRAINKSIAITQNDLDILSNIVILEWIEVSHDNVLEMLVSKVCVICKRTGKFLKPKKLKKITVLGDECNFCPDCLKSKDVTWLKNYGNERNKWALSQVD